MAGLLVEKTQVTGKQQGIMLTNIGQCEIFTNLAPVLKLL